MKKRSVFTALIVLLIVGAALFFAFRMIRGGGMSPGRRSGGAVSENPTKEAAAQPRRDSAEDSEFVTVRAAEAAQKTLVSSVSLTGEVRAREVVRAQPDTSGELSRFVVGTGDFVEKGRPIAWIDPSRPGSNFEEAPVHSPISGRITDLLVDRGAQVSAQTPVASIATLDDLQIIVAVPERYAKTVTRGMDARVSGIAIGNVELSARVTEVYPVLDPGSQSRETTLELTAGSGELMQGMNLRVALPLRSSGEAVTVPFAAIIQEGGKTSVYVVEESEGGKIVERRDVRTGMMAENLIEITEGLEIGELVVTEGIGVLRAGSKVRIEGQE